MEWHEQNRADRPGGVPTPAERQHSGINDGVESLRLRITNLHDLVGKMEHDLSSILVPPKDRPDSKDRPANITAKPPASSVRNTLDELEYGLSTLEDRMIQILTRLDF